jgi:hypothetical protein
MFCHQNLGSALNSDWIRIRIGIQPKMPDPDPKNTGPKHFSSHPIIYQISYGYYLDGYGLHQPNFRKITYVL